MSASDTQKAGFLANLDTIQAGVKDNLSRVQGKEKDETAKRDSLADKLNKASLHLHPTPDTVHPTP